MPPESPGLAKKRRPLTVGSGTRHESRTARWAAEKLGSDRDENHGPRASPPGLCASAGVSVSKPARPVSIVFYGIPPEVIASVCGVGLSTARSYKSGARNPSRSVITLMQLWSAGRILGPEFKGFRVNGNVIADPEGNCTTANQLRGYGIFMQLIQEWARYDEGRRAQVDAVMSIMEGRKRA